MHVAFSCRRTQAFRLRSRLSLACTLCQTPTSAWPQATKLKKSKKAEPVVEVKLPDLSGSHFELPAMVRRREETPISSGDDVKQQVLFCTDSSRPWLLCSRCVSQLWMLALYAMRVASERNVAHAQVRDRNRVAAAEAERRKDLRRVALEKRRTKVWHPGLTIHLLACEACETSMLVTPQSFCGTPYKLQCYPRMIRLSAVARMVCCLGTYDPEMVLKQYPALRVRLTAHVVKCPPQEDQTGSSRLLVPVSKALQQLEKPAAVSATVQQVLQEPPPRPAPAAGTAAAPSSTSSAGSEAEAAGGSLLFFLCR